MGLFGPKKAVIKSSDLARQYIDEIFSVEQKKLADNLLNKLKEIDNAFVGVAIGNFGRELAAIHLVILSAMWIEACLKAHIWQKEFLPDFIKTMLQDERCKNLKSEFEAYNNSMQQSMKTGISPYAHMADTLLERISDGKGNLATRQYLLVEFSELRNSMLNGFKLFEVK